MTPFGAQLVRACLGGYLVRPSGQCHVSMSPICRFTTKMMLISSVSALQIVLEVYAITNRVGEYGRSL